MNNLKELIFPLLILDESCNIVYTWSDLNRFESLQKSIISKKELIGSHLFSYDERHFEIMVVNDKGRLRPFWKYGLFNPLHKVDIFVKKMNFDFETSKNRILKVVMSDDSFWDEYPFRKSLMNEIKKSKCLKDIIDAFMAVEG